jgi:predicted dehydrogenase
MTIRVGLIGCGGIMTAHLRGWKAVEGRAQVVATADVDRARAEQRAAEVGGAKVFTDYHEMLTHADLDAVDISLPHYLHREAIVAAAEAGKHMIAEKPLCLTWQEAEEIIRAVESNRVTMMCAHNQLFLPTVQAARAYLDEGHLGDIYMLRTIDCFYNFRPTGIPGRAPKPVDLGWRASKALTGGGELIDTGYHPTYMLLYLARSEPVAVTAFTQKHRHQHMEGEDTGYVMIRFADGSVGHILTSWAFEFPLDNPRFQIIGEKGQVSGTNTAIKFKPNGWEMPAQHEFPPTDTFVAEIIHFVECLETGEPPIQTHMDGARVLRVLLAAYKSAEEGITVALS